jgi:glycosyltransferase involved in cell wall biosynthesis
MSSQPEPGRPSISFAIPYYDNLGYLAEAIESVRCQTFTDWELVVVDDAGPASAEVLVTSLGDGRVRYLRNEANLGLAGNWNRCIDAARSDWVTLLHADDRLEPAYAAAVTEAATDHPLVAAVFTDASTVGVDGEPVRSLPDLAKRFARRPRRDHSVGGDDGLASILSNNYVFCPSLCYRKAQLGTAPFDGRWGMVLDLDLVARLLLDGQQLFGVRRPLYQYRRHPAAMTGTLTATAARFEEELALYRELASTAAAHGWSRSAAAARRRTMVRAHLALRAGEDAARGRFPAARRKASLLQHDVLPRRHGRAS